MLSMVKEGSCGGSQLGLRGIKLSLEKKGPQGPFNDLAFNLRKKNGDLWQRMKEKAEYKVDLNCKEWLATLLRAEYSVCVCTRAPM